MYELVKGNIVRQRFIVDWWFFSNDDLKISNCEIPKSSSLYTSWNFEKVI